MKIQLEFTREGGNYTTTFENKGRSCEQIILLEGEEVSNRILTNITSEQACSNLVMNLSKNKITYKKQII